MNHWHAHSDLEGLELSSDQEPDIALVVCPQCGGDGGWDAERPGQSYLVCSMCKGSGWIDGDALDEEDVWQ